MMKFSVKVSEVAEWDTVDQWCKESLKRWRGDISNLRGNGHCGYYEFSPLSRSYYVPNKDTSFFILRWK